MRLSEWAEEHFYLSRESSYREGRWQSYPFQRAILDCMGSDSVRELYWMKSARVGYTKMLLAFMAYQAQHKRRNQALWQPTDDDADRFSKVEFDSMLRDVPVMHQLFPWTNKRHRNNTTNQKSFIGSTAYIRGGKAARSYRALSVDAAILDEADGFDQDVEKEGSPYFLAAKRIEGATFPKLIVGSTPKLKGLSIIEGLTQSADALFRFHIPCPHCDQFIRLRWGGKGKPYGFQWHDLDPDSVQHACDKCGVLFTQSDYLRVWEHGRWISDSGLWIDEHSEFRTATGEATIVERVAFHIWTAYSPMTSWSQLVREFLKAQAKVKQGDKALLKAFVNTTLGETWEEDVEQTDHNELMTRREDFPLRTVPRGALVLVAGVDVQDNRFEIKVWGIGRDEEMWTIDRVVLEANPADERDWDKLDQYLLSKFPHASGQMLGIEATSIDTGGHFTHQVYAFCRARTRRRLFAIKGDHRQGQPIKGRASLQDVNYKGKIIKRGVRLHLVGTDTAKDLLHGRLKITEPGPGCIHFSKDLDEDFFEQLTSEVRVLQRTATGEAYRWVRRSSVIRNEMLDCTVYALHAAHMLDLHRYTDKMWERLESVVQPPTGDLFAPAQPAAEPDPEPADVPTRKTARPARRRRRPSTFASNW